jgi:hypothetical protein
LRELLIWHKATKPNFTWPCLTKRNPAASNVKTMPIDLATLVTKSDDQISCELDGEVAILNLKSTLYFGLDSVGATVWDALSEPKTAADLCRAVLDRFDIADDQCREDVLELLTSLKKAGLIEIASPKPN